MVEEVLRLENRGLMLRCQDGGDNGGRDDFEERMTRILCFDEVEVLRLEFCFQGRNSVGSFRIRIFERFLGVPVFMTLLRIERV